MAILKEFHDFDPAKPFAIISEKQTISENKIRLDHTPLKGSVFILGFTENTSGKNILSNEFYIDYQEKNGYRTASQWVTFGNGNDGRTVYINYQGVGTLLLARDMNKIENFMDSIKISTDAQTQEMLDNVFGN